MKAYLKMCSGHNTSGDPLFTDEFIFYVHIQQTAKYLYMFNGRLRVQLLSALRTLLC
jgi:hypothetical protein